MAKNVVKSSNLDIVDAVSAIEHLFTFGWPKMTLEQKIDAWAKLKKLKSDSGALEQMYKNVSAEIRNHLDNKVGAVPGNQFVASLNFTPVKRLNTKRMKEEDPKTYEKWAETNDEARITYSIKV